MNTVKTTSLLATLTGLLLFMGLAFGGQTGMTVALGMAALMNFGAFYWSDKLVQRMYRAQPVGRARGWAPFRRPAERCLCHRIRSPSSASKGTVSRGCASIVTPRLTEGSQCSGCTPASSPWS